MSRLEIIEACMTLYGVNVDDLDEDCIALVGDLLSEGEN